MRKIYKILAIVTIATNAYGAWQVGNYFENIILSDTAGQISLRGFAKNTADYINGGVTFTYPTNTYSQTPHVSIAIQLKNAVYSNLESYVPIIIANSAISTTVRVNKITAGSISEAATDDITIYLISSGS